MSGPKKARLGKGLGALLEEYLPDEDDRAVGASSVGTVPVTRIAPNPLQPRRTFVPSQLAELAESIRENGLLQPLLLRPATGATRKKGVDFELVAGERRWRAVRKLGWTEVPAVVRTIDDRTLLVLAIVENVQRKNLSPVEEAAGYRELISEFGFTQKEVAASVGRERSTVANLLRLLQLPASVQQLVNEGDLSMGHARALLGLAGEREQASVARAVVKDGLSVREVERRVRSATAGPSEAPARPAAVERRDPHVRGIEQDLQRHFGTKVRIHVQGAERGRVEIPYLSGEDFERIVEHLLGTDNVRT